MAELTYDEHGRLLFTEAMRKEYTILVPQMAPYHFTYLVDALNSEGYNCELLTSTDYNLIKEGMKYSHNDICIPAMLVIGQFIDAVKQKRIEKEKVALIITQTGGGCRASNYINLLRKALKKANMEDVPVISLNAGGLESNPGFKVTPRLLHKLHDAVLIGDLMMLLVNQTRPYEIKKGATDALRKSIDASMIGYFDHKSLFSWSRSKKKMLEIMKAFKALEVDRTKKKPKVGIVGEIYVKYSPLGNNELEKPLKQKALKPSRHLFMISSYILLIQVHMILNVMVGVRKKLGF